MKNLITGFIRYFQIIFLNCCLTLLFSGSAYAMNADGFAWDQWLLLESNAGQPLVVKFSQKDEFITKNLVNVRIKSAADKQGKNQPAQPEAGDSMDWQQTFTLAALPLPAAASNYTLLQPNCSELPPLVTLGFALLFSLAPQLSAEQQGAPSAEQCSSFISRCRMNIPPMNDDGSRDLVIKEYQDFIFAQMADGNEPAPASVTISLSAADSSTSAQPVYQVRYILTCDSACSSVYKVYNLKPQESRIPFLYSPLLARFNDYFDTAWLAKEPTTRVVHEEPTAGPTVYTVPTQYLPAPTLVGVFYEVFCCGGCKTK